MHSILSLFKTLLLACGCLGLINSGLLAKQMNVLMIVADDMRAELGCLGNPVIQTPHLDKLAAEGALFERAYCQQAICNPSRMSFLTGLRPESNGITDMVTSLRQSMPDVVSFPQAFKNAGYYNLSYGKIFHFKDSISWSAPEWVPPPVVSYPIYMLPENNERQRLYEQQGKVYKLLPGWYGEPEPHIVKVNSWEAADADWKRYYDAQSVNKLIADLDSIPENKPFFIGMGFYRPHAPFTAPKEFHEMYDMDDIPAPDMSRHESIPDIEDNNWGDLRAYHDTPSEGKMHPRQAKRVIRAYYATITFVDWLIGKLIAELEERSLRDNTAIIFFSDHGYQLGEKNWWSKPNNLDVTTRVPLIINYPGMPNRGVRLKQLVELVDICPTVCEIAGIEAPKALDGESLIPFIENPNKEGDPAAYTEYHWKGYSGYTMKTERYRYTEWHREGADTIIELYDHRTDPEETVNIAQQPGSREVIRSLAPLLHTGWKNL